MPAGESRMGNVGAAIRRLTPVNYEKFIFQRGARKALRPGVRRL
jgi:hypothetical protein